MLVRDDMHVVYRSLLRKANFNHGVVANTDSA